MPRRLIPLSPQPVQPGIAQLCYVARRALASIGADSGLLQLGIREALDGLKVGVESGPEPRLVEPIRCHRTPGVTQPSQGSSYEFSRGTVADCTASSPADASSALPLSTI